MHNVDQGYLSCAIGAGILSFAIFAQAAESPSRSPAIECASLTSMDFTSVVINVAATTTVREKALTGLSTGTFRVEVSHCRVVGTIDGTIGFELLLPDEWNRKFVMGGHGGYAGTLSNQAQDFGAVNGTPLERGYATVGTDTGHQASMRDASWALHDDEAVRNFAGRGVHRTAEISKTIISAYYGNNVDRSYFLGCSGGGFQALMAVQRYPTDFDGVSAGAPALDRIGGAARRLQIAQKVFPGDTGYDEPVITESNLNLVTGAIREKCDALDGVQDGLVSNPQFCQFDPASLPKCSIEPGPDCLTDSQLDVLQHLFMGPLVDGELVSPGIPPTSEMDLPRWQAWSVKAPPGMLPPEMPSLVHLYGQQFARYFVFRDPNWSISGYDFSDWDERSQNAAALFDVNDPDIASFRDSGGKLLIWHGWSDPGITPLGSLKFYNAVEEQDENIRDFTRLYLMPGVLHCAGGSGPDRVDWLAALEQWVEEDQAPDAVSAFKFDQYGKTMIARPVCPYPRIAVYQGGDPNRRQSFRCENP
jgi:feruloyl esterase